MRIANSFKNSIISIFSYLIIFLCNLVVRKVLILSLGPDYVGINGLFNNILSILSIAELGIGASIIYHLYGPIAQNKYEVVSGLMKFYKKCYNFIAFFIFFVGLMITPFIYKLIGQVYITESLYLLFILSLIDVVSTYLLSYKRSIFLADQKNYIITFIHLIQVIILTAIRVVILEVIESYILFISISIIFNILENLIISLYANKKYSFIKTHHVNINKKLKKDIITKVKGVLFHRIGGTLIQSTDSVIISNCIGISILGIYSNYSSILLSLQSMLNTIFNSLISSVGNMLVCEDSLKVNQTFDNMFFINNSIYVWISSLLLICLQPFIFLWIGHEYLISNYTLTLVIIVFHLQGIRKVLDMFTSAAGIFYENKFIPILECCTNLTFSLILVKFFQLNGVFLGTIISQIITFVLGYHNFLNKIILKRNKIEFFKLMLKYLVVDIIIITLIVILSFVITGFVSSNIALLFGRIIIGSILCIVGILMFFKNTKELEFSLILMKKFKNLFIKEKFWR